MYSGVSEITDTSGTGLLSVVERCPILGDCLSNRSTDLNSIRATSRSVRSRRLSVVGGCPFWETPL